MSEDPAPGVGPSSPTVPWEEYERLEAAVQDYLDHDPDDPAYADIWRALGAMLGEYQRDAFCEAFDLDRPADMACVRRLITGEDECNCDRSWKDRELEAIGARDDPPHSPPHSDHATLWLDEDGEPALYSMHVYPGEIEMHVPSSTAVPDQERRNGWIDVVEWASEWGLEVSILPKSWYNLGSTVHVAFVPPERYRTSSAGKKRD